MMQNDLQYFLNHKVKGEKVQSILHLNIIVIVAGWSMLPTGISSFKGLPCS